MPMKQNAPIEKQLFSPDELAEKLGVCTATIRRMEAKGMIKGIRFNRRLVRYSLEEVNKLIQGAHLGRF